MKRFCRFFVLLIVLSCWMNVASAQVVNMPDENLAAVVRDQLGLAPGTPITRQALLRLGWLWASSGELRIQQLIGQGGRIKDLTGLEHATNLGSLVLHWHDIKDIGHLKGLTQLTRLELTGNDISHLGPLKGLTQLRSLEISYNPINDFSPLAGLTQLRHLEVTVRSMALMDNLHRHVDLKQLERLHLVSGRGVGDLRPFANLTQLKHFGFIGAQISDVTPLAGLTQLQDLRLSSNQISDVTPLAGLTQLRYLGLGSNQISDVTPLAGLTQLQHLHLSNNQISDVKPLAGLTQLLILGLRNNQIRDITPIENLRATMWLEGNPIGKPPEEEAGLVVESVKAKRYIAPEEWFDLHVTVLNPGTEKSAGTQLIVYRSVNEDISEDDIAERSVHIVPLLGHTAVTRTLRVRAPKTVGTYYYGACIADNKCSTQPAKLTVTQPALKISSIKAGQKEAPPDAMKKRLTVAPGGPFDLSINILNEGKKPSDKTTVRFYRSTDAQIPTGDWEIRNAAIDIEKVEPGKSLENRRSRVWAPDAPGTYYYGACVDTVAPERNPDNNCSDTVEITVGNLEPPSNLISDVAFVNNETYFIVNAQFPKLLLKNQEGVTYGSCFITLDIPGVPEDPPLQTWDSENDLLKNEPPYFMYPLLSPRQRIDALKGKYDLDATEVAIGGITSAVLAGTGVGQKVAQKFLPFIPLGKVTKGVVSIGSKFKVWIPPLSVEQQFAKGSRYVISKVIGTSTDYVIGKTITGAYIIGRGLIAGNEKEPTIEEELLANTADPILTLMPMSAGNTRPPDVSRYLFRIPGAVADIGIKIEQVYFRKNVGFTAVYEGTRNLGNAAAPGLHAMSLADYPPFQHLPPEIQEYLRRDFGAFTSAETQQVPETTALLPNYPNPFNPETWIPYQLSEPTDVTLTIYDIHGRIVRALDFGHQRAGMYHTRSRAAYWDGRNAVGEPVASGVYFYTLKAGEFSATRKMLIRK